MSSFKSLMVMSVVLGFFAGCATAPETTGAAAAPSAEASAEKSQEKKPAAAEVPAQATAKNIAFADIPFRPFNPKKPEGIHVYPLSRNPADGPFNAIVRFPAGFSMPLHSHTHGYSGFALGKGLFHGSAADKAHDVTPSESWYEPAGEPHVDGCKGDSPCYFLVSFEGAVDMRPEKTPSAEPKAQSTAYADLVWNEVKGGVKMSVLKGNPKEGAFIALFDFPAGMQTNIHTHSASFDGVVISGTHHRGANADSLVTLPPNSVWHEPANSPHMEKCGADSRCVLWVSMDGALDTKDVELTPSAK